MNKKLLLTTILSSAIMSSEVAQATVFDLTYNGNNDFVFQGDHYSFTALNQFFSDQERQGIINFKNDDIKITKASQRKFLDDLIAGGEFRAQFITGLAAE
jgi:hypothetical protein